MLLGSCPWLVLQVFVAGFFSCVLTPSLLRLSFVVVASFSRALSWLRLLAAAAHGLVAVRNFRFAKFNGDRLITPVALYGYHAHCF